MFEPLTKGAGVIPPKETVGIRINFDWLHIN